MEYLPPSLIRSNLPFVEDKATFVVSQPPESSEKASFVRKNLTKKQKMDIILGVLIGLALVTKALQKTTKDFHSQIQEIGLGETYNSLVQNSL